MKKLHGDFSFYLYFIYRILRKQPGGDDIYGIYLASKPADTVYQTCEVFNPTEMTDKATYSDGTENVVTDYTYDKTSPLTVSDTTVTVSYSGKSVGLI